MDRRIRRTKNAVFNAVIDLMIEKEAGKITVLELCKKADINKSTFYLHYTSIDDCIQKCFKVIMNDLIEFSKLLNYDEIKANPKPMIDSMIDGLSANSDTLYRFKNSRICGPSVKVLKENLVKNIASHNGFTKEKNYSEIANITFVVSGFIDVFIEMLPNIDKDLLSDTICKMIKAFP